METPDAIRNFWFGSHPDDAVTAQQRSKLWWSKNQDNDMDIRKRYQLQVEAAAKHEFDNWARTPTGSLALILLTDQFPRNIYRDLPKAFHLDAVAQNLCLTGLNQQFDRKLRPIERVFFYLPLEHSESAAHQELSVQLFTRLYQEVRADHMDTFRSFLIFALRHRRVIERFGRFPHRNGVLERESTAEELEFLQEAGSSF